MMWGERRLDMCLVAVYGSRTRGLRHVSNMLSDKKHIFDHENHPYPRPCPYPHSHYVAKTEKNQTDD